MYTLPDKFIRVSYFNPNIHKKAVLKQKLILILRQPLSFIRMYFIYSHGFQSLDKANTLPIVMPSASFVVS